MKNLISLLLVLAMCLSLCACGGNGGSEAEKPNDAQEPADETEETVPSGTPLTLDNYADYLSVHVYLSDPGIGDEGLLNVQSMNGGMGIPAGDSFWTYYVAKSFDTGVQVAGVSDNFIYTDVVVTVKFSGTYQTVNLETSQWTEGGTVDTELTVDCNVAGKGSVSGKIQGNGGYMHTEMADITWEVVAISGYVERA